MYHYERVTFDGKTRTLKVVGESPTFLRGYECNREGDEIRPKKADPACDDVVLLHLIDKTLITKRVRLAFDRKYGTLIVERRKRGEV